EVKAAGGEVEVDPNAPEHRRGAHLGERQRVRDGARIAAQTEEAEAVAHHRNGDRRDDPRQSHDDHDFHERIARSIRETRSSDHFDTRWFSNGNAKEDAGLNGLYRGYLAPVLCF